MKRLSDIFVLCQENDEIDTCLELMKDTLHMLRTDEKKERISIPDNFIPPSLMLELIKKSLNIDSSDEKNSYSVFKIQSVPKKVSIKDPEVSSINLIPTNKENKVFKTSTHFQDFTYDDSEAGESERSTKDDDSEAHESTHTNACTVFT